MRILFLFLLLAGSISAQTLSPSVVARKDLMNLLQERKSFLIITLHLLENAAGFLVKGQKQTSGKHNQNFRRL
jgi:hypothetical protein